MNKSYKPLTPPDKTAYEPYIKPKYVSDETPKKSKYKGRMKQALPKPLYQKCEKCGNIINLLGECDFCGHTNSVKYFSTLAL